MSTTLSKTNWSSLAATAAADVGAIVVNVVPHAVSTPINAVILGVAGLLTLAHVHVPSVVAALVRSQSPTAVAAEHQAVTDAATQIKDILGKLQ